MSSARPCLKRLTLALGLLLDLAAAQAQGDDPSLRLNAARREIDSPLWQKPTRPCGPTARLGL